jgi:hypothetical protein
MVNCGQHRWSQNARGDSAGVEVNLFLKARKTGPLPCPSPLSLRHLETSAGICSENLRLKNCFTHECTRATEQGHGTQFFLVKKVILKCKCRL